jgi:anti-sigma factor RsiW
VTRYGGIDCQDMVELVTAYAEGALDPDMRARFERHLADCDWCIDYVNQLEATVRLVAGLDPVDLCADAHRALLEAFRARPARP